MAAASMVSPVEGLADSHRKDRVGAGFDKHPVPVGERVADRLVELDRLAEVAVPVVGGKRGGVEQAAGDGGVERDVRRVGGDPGQGVQQLFPDAFDLRGVGRVADGDGAGIDAVGPVSGE